MINGYVVSEEYGMKTDINNTKVYGIKSIRELVELHLKIKTNGKITKF